MPLGGRFQAHQGWGLLQYTATWSVQPQKHHDHHPEPHSPVSEQSDPWLLGMVTSLTMRAPSLHLGDPLPPL